MAARLEELIREWTGEPAMAGCFTAATTLIPRQGSYAPLPEWLDSRLVGALRSQGIEQLYSHQAAAVAAARAGRNVVLVTPTASGKTLAYNLPVLQAIVENPAARAIYLFPTKALAQDQYAQLHELIETVALQVGSEVYDGDTPADARQAIRERGQVVMTNPDMLHSAILPHHTRWLELFTNLKYVVIDELHTYRGVFGSHLANVLRRLQRIAAFHGSRPVFICCSATIANPRELAEGLLEQPVELVDRSGSPAGGRHVLLYNPPVVNSQLGIRASYLKQACKLATELIVREIPTIVFALSRLNVELLVKYLREGLDRRRIAPGLVQGYRGGYLPNRRREIERGLREGRIRCVVATNALELGIDIGSLEAAIVAGYPGSQASLLQQWGRAGRKSGASLAIFVSRSDPLDQYVVTHPDFLLGRSPEEARIDPDNPFILADHLKCAAFELPFRPGEGFGRVEADRLEGIFRVMEHARLVHRVGGRTHWSCEAYPASAVSLRNIPGENFVVIDQEHGKIVAEVDFVSAHTMLHEGAIHNIDGLQYQVKRLDYEGRKAFVQRDETDFFTDAENYVEVRIIRTEESDSVGCATRSQGEVAVTEKVVGYKKIRFHTSENVGYGQVSLPELTMHTMACWIAPAAETIAALPFPRAEIADAMTGVARALHVVAALRLLCATGDLGHCVGDQSARWFSAQGADSRGGYDFDEQGEGRFAPTIFLFDRRAGGVGLAPGAYALMGDLLRATRGLIGDCPCEAGCPACVGPRAAAGSNPKLIALEILDSLALDDERPGA